MVYGADHRAPRRTKIFDADRQIALVFTEKALLVAATAAVAFLVDLGPDSDHARVLSLVSTTALALWFAAGLGALAGPKVPLLSGGFAGPSRRRSMRRARRRNLRGCASRFFRSSRAGDKAMWR